MGLSELQTLSGRFGEETDTLDSAGKRTAIPWFAACHSASLRRVQLCLRRGLVFGLLYTAA